MSSSPLIPEDRVSSLTDGSINARRIASWLRLQHKGDFWLQGTPTSPVYPTPFAKQLFYRERRIMIYRFLKN